MSGKSACCCPFDCGGIAYREEGRDFGVCILCRATVYFTTSIGRLKIIDQQMKDGAIAMEISQVVDYCNRREVPAGIRSKVVFAVRQVVFVK